MYCLFQHFAIYHTLLQNCVLASPASSLFIYFSNLIPRYYPNHGGSATDLDEDRAPPLSAIFVHSPKFPYGTRYISSQLDTAMLFG